METQADYEAVVLLAVFRSAEASQAADVALQSAGVEHTQHPLQPGRYQVADPSLRTYTRLIVGAAIAGALFGAIIGVVVALRQVGADGLAVFWFAVAGAVGGAVIGGLIGLAMRAQYDDN